MKLYDVPNNTLVRVISNEKIPKGSLQVYESEVIKFINIDGMYSYCKNMQGEVVHLVAWADVEIVE